MADCTPDGFKAYLIGYHNDRCWIKSKTMITDYLQHIGLESNIDRLKKLRGTARNHIQQLHKEGKIERYNSQIWRVI